MQKIALILCCLLVLSSCKSKKTAKSSTRKSHQTVSTYEGRSSDYNNKVNAIVDYAETFEGVKYKYGGTTKKGMDCSGLVTTAYQKEAIALPRTTSQLAVTGDWVDVKEVQKGDLLFFATKKNSRNVNHVGIVTEARPGYVAFIHSTTSKGVITSLLSEKYWYFAFVQARRIL
ncbi:NlpC/P60 family protein [Hanstruepera neustonica]|uniref:NlpC/P60 family protein n=1 Tax=Hanstruepera neustonica TaxID=1445657 RepID=A0A2K1E4M3_9FLAO|nr:C40 family peptidase [Hanstruepera neustonica]PNQ75234.1 NlpC/P60 family protein [Hanstruepera neustonica]